MVSQRKDTQRDLDLMDERAENDAEKVFHALLSGDFLADIPKLNRLIRTKLNVFSLVAFIELAENNERRLRAWRQHSPLREAREFVQADWERNRNAYKNNKSAFSRDYVKRVWNELHVCVTEKQMREVWLRDTPSAGKPAG